MKQTVFYICVLFSSAVFAQNLPDTDIFLIQLSKSIKGKITVSGQPENLTNRKGYDNQPCFLPDGKGLLYTAADESEKTDIFRIYFDKQPPQNLTNTPTTSEYSPIPLEEHQAFTVVRVEEDTKTQRLWQFPLSGKGDAVYYQPHLTQVGYYTQARQNGKLVMFMVTDPPTLQTATLTDTSGFIAAVNIGRCVAAIPGKSDAVSFLHKLNDNQWLIKRLKPGNLDTKTIIQALPGSEDYAWLPDENLLMAKDSRLYWLPKDGQEWIQIADFTKDGIKNITRLAVSSDGKKLAIVATVHP